MEKSTIPKTIDDNTQILDIDHSAEEIAEAFHVSSSKISKYIDIINDNNKYSNSEQIQFIWNMDIKLEHKLFLIWGIGISRENT